MKGKRYSQEFKNDAVRHWIKSGESADEVARSLGVTTWSLRRWKSQALSEMDGKALSDGATMKAHEEEHEVKEMAKLMRVSRSGFYRKRAGRKSTRAQEDEVLSERIERIHCRSRGTSGSPKITRKLAREGTRLGKNRVARMMRLRGLTGVGRGRRWFRTTRQDPRLLVSPNLIKGLPVTGSNQVWVADITHVDTDEGWGYLAAVLDLWSRKVVGWSFKSHMESSLVCQAMKSALDQRRPPTGLIGHSARGS